MNVLQNIKKRLTVFDMVFIAVLVFALLGFLIFFQRQNTAITLRIKVSDPNIQFITAQPWDEYAHAFVKGDKELNELGQTVSEIVDVDAYKTDPSKQVLYLDIRVKAVYSPRKKQYTVKGKPIVFGQSMSFVFSKVKFEGLVVNFPGFTDKDAKKEHFVRVKTQLMEASRNFSDTYGLPDFLAQPVKEGDEIKNSEGKVLVKVVSKQVLPAKRTVFSNGQSFLVDDLRLKDVFYTLDVLVNDVNGRMYMFDFQPVYIGTSVPLNFPNVSVWPTIISIDSDSTETKTTK